MRKGIFLSTAACLGLLAPGYAYAAEQADQADQATPDERASQFNDIVVTARRRAEDVATVPISISAFGGEALERRGVVDLGDVTKITPGFALLPGGSKANPFITIRGQSKGITGNINPGVIPYLNDVPLPNYGSMIPTYDIANIQVLKGPQGTLFGRNAIGGAVLVNTNMPTHLFGGSVKMEVARFDFRQFEGVVNLPIVQDVIALRLATQIYHDGGFVPTQLVTPYTVNPTTGIATPGILLPSKHKIEEFSGQSFRASLLIEPSDGISNVTVFEYNKIRGMAQNQLSGMYPNGYKGESGGAGGAQAAYFKTPAELQALVDAGRLSATVRQNILNLAQCGTSIVCDFRLVQNYFTSEPNFNGAIISTDPWKGRTITWGVTNTTSIDLGDHATIKNIFGYRNTDSFVPTDNDGTPLAIVLPIVQVRLRQLSNELQLSGDLFDNKLKYTVGGFYYNESPDGPGGNQALEVNSLFGLSHTLGVTYLHNKSKAVYGQIDYSLDPLIPGLTLTAGVRQTWDSVSGCAAAISLSGFSPMSFLNDARSPFIPTEEQCRNNTINLANYLGATRVVAQNFAEAKFKKLTYTLGANWQITPGLMVYGAHRRGYRAGSYNTPLFNQQFLGQIQAFRPETLTDWEIGTKIRWNGGGMRGSFDLAVFSGKDKEQQLPVQTSALTNVCVPEALSIATDAPLCTTTAGVQGRTINHPAATTILNAGELTIRGFEASATISPFQGVTLGAGVSYVDYKVDKITLDGNLQALLAAGNVAVPTTIVLQQQPKWTYNGSIDVILPGKFLGGELSAGLNWKHSGAFLSTASGLINPPYDVLDARVNIVNIGETGVTLSAYVMNLTDEHYSYGISSGAPQSLGVETRMYSQPRTLGLSVKYEFGS